MPPPAGSRSREGFALSGPSIVLDPTAHAIRADLADIRMAAHVFAPHYAAHLPHRVARDAELHAARDAGSVVLTMLAPGEMFEVLEFAGIVAWGIAPAKGLVGYVAADALEAVA